MSGGDPFTFEIIQNSVDAICEEMFSAMRRAAASSAIYEVLDFGVAIGAANGDIASQGTGIPIFVGMLEPGLKAVVAKFRGASILPGDVFIANDPWNGGASHLNDVSLMMPVFSGRELIAWTANKGHWSDLGGMVPGGVALEAFEVYQEGLQIPPIKLIDQGVEVPGVMDLLRANSRMPEILFGDMWAGVAALRLGAKRLSQLAETYGAAVFTQSVEHYLRYGEVVSRNCLKGLPKGRFRASRELESIGKIQVEVAISDHELVVDLRGNPKPMRGPTNCPYEITVAGVKVAFKAVTDPQGVCNAGTFRPLRVLCDEDSLFSAARPVSVGLYHEPVMFVTELVLSALAEHLPDRLGAGTFGSVAALVIGGSNPRTGKSTYMIEPECGGWGAALDRDGENAQFSPIDGETFNTPVELNEARNGVFVRQYGFHNADGGEGQYRGGRGIILEYELLNSAWATGVFTPNFLTRPWGLAGGLAGSSNRVEFLRKDGTTEVIGKFSNVQLAAGDVIRIVTGHGGGYGDPTKRSREKVAEDLRNGFITAEQASSYYGFTTLTERS